MTLHSDDPRLTAYALGELDGPESAQVEAWLETNPEVRRSLEEVREFARVLTDQLRVEPSRTASRSSLQQAIARELEREREQAPEVIPLAVKPRSWFGPLRLGVLAASLLLVATASARLLLPVFTKQAPPVGNAAPSAGVPGPVASAERQGWGFGLGSSEALARRPGAADSAAIAPGEANLWAAPIASEASRQSIPVLEAKKRVAGDEAVGSKFAAKSEFDDEPQDADRPPPAAVALAPERAVVQMAAPEGAMPPAALESGTQVASKSQAPVDRQEKRFGSLGEAGDSPTSPATAPAGMLADEVASRGAGQPDRNRLDQVQSSSKRRNMKSEEAPPQQRADQTAQKPRGLALNTPDRPQSFNLYMDGADDKLAGVAPQAAAPQGAQPTAAPARYSPALSGAANTPAPPGIGLAGEPPLAMAPAATTYDTVPGQGRPMLGTVGAKPARADSRPSGVPAIVPADPASGEPLGRLAKDAASPIADGNQGDPALPEGFFEKAKAGKELREAEVEPRRHDLEAAVPERIVPIDENPFVPVTGESALSTLSVDVDTASYARVRQSLKQHEMPAPSEVRIEEMLNYFSWSYPEPRGNEPLSVATEVTRCPWEPAHGLLRIGIKGKAVTFENRQPANLVFLVDVSGSMDQPAKLPLARAGLRMLAQQLGENDNIALVTYAGRETVVLPPTSGANQPEILSAIDQLVPGGSTNGEAGYVLAYKVAAERFQPSGINRVILCTDGDFNVGLTRKDDLVALATEKAKSGVLLNVLGFGDREVNDTMLEQMADKGNGQYAFIDNLLEARKVFIDQIDGTLVTIARDTKIQVEFQPQHVSAYRLVGYENRRMENAEFRNDMKDAGEIGSGLTVTALYELVPPQSTLDGIAALDDLLPPGDAARNDPNTLAVVRIRYKEPDGKVAPELDFPVPATQVDLGRASPDTRFAASVAMFGMILRHSAHAGQASLNAVLELAEANQGTDAGRYRAEFVDLVRRAIALQQLEKKLELAAPVGPE